MLSWGPAATVDERSDVRGAMLIDDTGIRTTDGTCLVSDARRRAQDALFTAIAEQMADFSPSPGLYTVEVARSTAEQEKDR